MHVVTIKTDTIKLNQFLKWSGAVSSGSEANALIKSGLVKVNGLISTERGKKLKRGDTVVLDDGTQYILK